MRKNKIILGIIIFCALIVRVLPLDFPVFTSDEARIAYRGYTLAREGRDELGRPFPFVFNSLEDYQLPSVSYITALGIAFFGKNDFGARIPFIVIGTGIVFLTLRVAEIFFGGKNFGFFAAIIVSLSPALIFFSKFPNEFIVAAFLILLLILEIFKERTNIIKISAIILLMLLTSKILWLILIPLVLLGTWRIVPKMRICSFCMVLVFVSAAFFLFLKIPQGERSLIENNFSIIKDLTVKNGIEKLRGEGVDWWPLFLDRILFNKAYLLPAGIFHWFSQFNLSRMVADFDPAGIYGYLKTGAFQKILIIPFLTGIYFLIKSNSKRIFLYIILLTLPLVFLYPKHKIELIIPALPFIALITAVGFKYFNRRLTSIIVLVLMAEFVLNLFFIGASIKNSNQQRPVWLKNIITEASLASLNYNIAFSDDIAEDIVPLFEWHAKFDQNNGYEDIKFPYRYRQSKISNIKVIGSQDLFYNCGLDKAAYIFASKRDLEKIQGNIKTLPEKSYKDFLNKDAVFLMPPNICVK